MDRERWHIDPDGVLHIGDLNPSRARGRKPVSMMTLPCWLVFRRDGALRLLFRRLRIIAGQKWCRVGLK